mgnify:CR=1 FL=1
MAKLTSPSVVCVVPDKLGGMLNIVEGLFRFRRPDEFTYGVILTNNPLGKDARFNGRFNADYQAAFEFKTPIENLHAVLRRLNAAIPAGEGVLLANDLLELAMASAFDTGRAVIQMLHGDSDYYYDLAARHENVIDAFIVYGRTMERKLKRGCRIAPRTSTSCRTACRHRLGAECRPQARCASYLRDASSTVKRGSSIFRSSIARSPLAASMSRGR